MSNPEYSDGITKILEALDNLVEQIEIEGMTHSERCGCDYCEALALAKRIVKENE